MTAGVLLLPRARHTIGEDAAKIVAKMMEEQELLAEEHQHLHDQVPDP